MSGRQMSLVWLRMAKQLAHTIINGANVICRYLILMTHEIIHENMEMDCLSDKSLMTLDVNYIM